MKGTIISTMFIAVAFVLAASCNKNENPVSPADKTVITAVAEHTSGFDTRQTLCSNTYCQNLDMKK